MTVVLPAPLRPTSATTEPPGTVTLKSRTTGTPFAIFELDVFEPDLVHDARRVDARPARSGLSASMPSTSNTRSIAASERCSSENEFTICQTGFSSRNVYHWNAMMSPIDGAPTRFR